MATLKELETDDVLHNLAPSDDAPAPERLFYASDRLRKWLNESLPAMASDWDLEITPIEQVGDLIDVFCGGNELAVETMFKCLNPHENGVWELKTEDVRIFGWFYRPDCFIGHCADNATRIKKHRLYTGYSGEVQRFRDEVDLDPPKFIAGTNPNAVVSNCS
jgi:hypothetical protein